MVASAAINPGILNEISFDEHNARPTIIGTKDKLTKKPVCSPKMKINDLYNINIEDKDSFSPKWKIYQFFLIVSNNFYLNYCRNKT